MFNNNHLKRHYPLVYWADNSLLRSVCQDILKITNKHKVLAKNLLILMHEYDGVGLAAPQIWKLYRMAAVTQRNTSKKNRRKNDEFVMINPKILFRSEELESDVEWCLSLPWVEWRVTRSSTITVQYTKPDWTLHIHKATWFNARVILHEIDHLDWILFIDKLDWKWLSG